ncbi:MAG: lipopolysaccharide biosynthesis protein [Candidatus Andeanibacterium colombiense]|uniref:Lipopolysaccharide biosynthesis protein n=1 Tax=Candidatus Andeanibacterium colombiense TaxID=3121345 RepID=A0AAJ5X822_9SPHN|nr:MAG: lipopolysaccharide biosynthesis protein [Sphingomonadaceae bacterium]
MNPAPEGGDIAALAKGGRTNFIGFLLRLAARIPFLFIAARFYGPEEMGKLTSALVAIELASQLATFGQKRGLAVRLASGDQDDAHAVADAMVLSTLLGAIFTVFLFLFPGLIFPKAAPTEIDLLLPLSIIPYTLTDISLAALAFRFDVGATVKARSLVEPWALSLMAAAAMFLAPHSGLTLAYNVSIFAAGIYAVFILLDAYGAPRGWAPHPGRTLKLALENAPLAMADMVEWGTRRIDVALLTVFASPTAVGVYYFAQQVASLPQKLKTSFEPILGPVITRNLKEQNYAAIAKQVCQVGFWITAMQAGVALALGIPGEAIMGLGGPEFVGGTGALAFLLVAEVLAATAVVSEAALIYMARIKNLWVSLFTISLQAALTAAIMLAIQRYHKPELWYSAGAASALMLTLGTASLIKSRLLSRILHQPINNWRWALIWAAAPAMVVGWIAVQLPEWAELAFGVPAILGVYGWMIWNKGFGPEDRLLFRKGVAPQEA